MGAIDVGPGASDRATYFSPGRTLIDLANPANDTGTLDTIELWFLANATDVKAGTFYGSSTSYTNRDGATIGNVTAGSKQTFSGLSIDVETGDYAGAYWFVCGSIEADNSEGYGIYWKAGDQFGTGAQTYALYASYAISIYGTGANIGPVLIQASSNCILNIDRIFNMQGMVTSEKNSIVGLDSQIHDFLITSHASQALSVSAVLQASFSRSTDGLLSIVTETDVGYLLQKAVNCILNAATGTDISQASLIESMVSLVLLASAQPEIGSRRTVSLPLMGSDQIQPMSISKTVNNVILTAREIATFSIARTLSQIVELAHELRNSLSDQASLAMFLSAVSQYTEIKEWEKVLKATGDWTKQDRIRKDPIQTAGGLIITTADGRPIEVTHYEVENWTKQDRPGGAWARA